jgi:ribose transport system substrate-binding protein
MLDVRRGGLWAAVLIVLRGMNTSLGFHGRGWGIAWVLMAALSGCQQPTQRLVVVAKGESAFWEAVRTGLTDAARDFRLSSAGLSAVQEATDGTVEGQVAVLRRLGNERDVVGIAIAVADPSSEPLAEELRKLRGRGIAVITVDSDVDRSKFRPVREAYVGTGDRTDGAVLGEVANALRPEGGGFVTFSANPFASGTKARISGFVAGAGPKFQELDNLPDDGNPTRMRDNVRSAMSTHGDKLKVLVALDSQNAPAVGDVVGEQHNRDQYAILGVDADPKTMQMLGEGVLDAALVQNPYRMGYESVRLLAALATKDEAAKKQILPKLGQPDGDLVDTGLRVVVPDEGSPLTQEMLSGKAEVFRLGEFRQWLHQRNLSGS